MNKLLSAGFWRMLKSRIFILLMIFMFAFGIYFSASSYYDMKKYHYTSTFDNFFFTYLTFMGIVIAIFCTLFIGTEYSDGTIRNKLVAGHFRASIYISNLILCTVATIAFSCSYIVSYSCVGVPLLGLFHMELKTVLVLILCSVMTCIAYTSIFTFVAMIIHRKAVLAIVSVITAFMFMFAATYLYSSLSQPKMNSDYFIKSGAIEKTEPVPNKYYVSGTKRKVYEFLMEFLPSGQVILLLNENVMSVRFIFYDCLIIISTTGIGLFGFSKKDIN